MKVKIEFSCDNAAFDDDFAKETSLVIQHLAKCIEQSGSEYLRKGRVFGAFDENGNRIGECRIEPEGQ